VHLYRNLKADQVMKDENGSYQRGIGSKDINGLALKILSGVICANDFFDQVPKPFCLKINYTVRIADVALVEIYNLLPECECNFSILCLLSIKADINIDVCSILFIPFSDYASVPRFWAFICVFLLFTGFL
jgi:hypothetical protein